MLARLNQLQSGSPPVNADELAPYHSGLQMIKMDETEFVHRCMKTKGVSEERATAFYAFLWRMHADSKKIIESQPELAPNHYGESSAVSAKISAIPFKKRIRPGMIVRYKPKQKSELKVDL